MTLGGIVLILTESPLGPGVLRRQVASYIETGLLRLLYFHANSLPLAHRDGAACEGDASKGQPVIPYLLGKFQILPPLCWALFPPKSTTVRLNQDGCCEAALPVRVSTCCWLVQPQGSELCTSVVPEKSSPREERGTCEATGPATGHVDCAGCWSQSLLSKVSADRLQILSARGRTQSHPAEDKREEAVTSQKVEMAALHFLIRPF